MEATGMGGRRSECTQFRGRNGQDGIDLWAWDWRKSSELMLRSHAMMWGVMGSLTSLNTGFGDADSNLELWGRPKFKEGLPR